MQCTNLLDFLGLDFIVRLSVAIWQLVIALWNTLARTAWRRRRVLPTSPRDAYATQEWGPAP
jgi:hypothetical protein